MAEKTSMLEQLTKLGLFESFGPEMGTKILEALQEDTREDTLSAEEKVIVADLELSAPYYFSLLETSNIIRGFFKAHGLNLPFIHFVNAMKAAQMMHEIFYWAMRTQLEVEENCNLGVRRINGKYALISYPRPEGEMRASEAIITMLGGL